jgi:protein TonB
MTQSIVRAEQFDLQTSVSPFYTWEVPQKPVSVRIPYDLMDRLEKEAVENFRSLSSRGSEIGGLLVGRVSPGSPMIVSLSDYEMIACYYSRGPLYRLSDADMGRFERAIEQRLAAGQAVAGFFRSHTRKGMTLDADDLTFFEQRFRDPHHLVLLVRTYATKASTAGIFIREGGKVNGESSLLEFPFRSSELGPMKSGADRADGWPKPPASSPLTPAAPKPAARAQVVPIASRRETSAPAEPGVPALPAAPAVEEKSAKTDKPVKNEKPPAKIEKFERTEKPAAAAKAAIPEKTAPSAKTPAIVKQEAGQEAGQPAPAANKTLKMLLAAAATIALFVGLFVYPGVLRHGAKTAALAHQDSSLLQLRVERTAGELLLTCNRDADPIKTATKAVLSISDGERHENVQMDLAQLRNGSIVYSPSSADTSFTMDVTGQNNTTTVSESVRVLRTRPSPLEEQNAQSGAQPATGAAAAQTSTPAEEPAAKDETKPAVALKPFTAEPLAQRLRPASNTDLPEAPTVSAGAVPSSIPGVNLNAVMQGPAAPRPLAPVAPAPAAPVSTPASEVKAPAKAGGQIQQATLLYKKDPEYPKMAKQTGAKGQVKLVATIGKNGKVKGVRVLSGHPMLQNAAMDAVLQWVYKPALLNGVPVETETEVVINFLGSR